MRVTTVRSSSGPLPQLPPTASAPQAVSPATACSGETPIIVWPRVSKVIVATRGMPGATRRTPSMAALISVRSDIVSIQIRSTPPATSAAACSAKTSTPLRVVEGAGGRHDRPARPDVTGDERLASASVDLAAKEDRRRLVDLGDPALEAMEPQSQPVAAERVGHHDPGAGLEVPAVDPPDDVGMAEIPDLRRVAELQAGREQHRAHRAIGKDRLTVRQECLPASPGGAARALAFLDPREGRGIERAGLRSIASRGASGSQHRPTIPGARSRSSNLRRGGRTNVR